MPLGTRKASEAYTDWGTRPAINPETGLDPVDKPGALETLGAAFRLENTVGSILSQQAGMPQFGQKPNPDFDPFEHLPEDKKFFANRYIRANSKAEVEAISRQIDREEEDRQTLSEAGAWGVAANIGAGIVDPINFIPLGGAGYKTYRVGGSILRSALKTAAIGAGTMTMTEAVLQSTQQTRTPEESAWNIASGTFLSGVLGGATSVWSQAVRSSSKKTLEELGVGLEQELTVPKTGRYTKEEIAEVLTEYDEASAELSRRQSVTGKVVGMDEVDPDLIAAEARHEAAKARYEEMIQDVHEPDPFEPGSFEVSEEALARDVAYEEADDAIFAELPKRPRQDFFGVEESADVPAEKPLSARKAKAQTMDEMEKMLNELVADPNVGEIPATDFLREFDIEFKPDKKTGAGTGFQVFIPGVGNVPFRRGDTVGTLMGYIGDRIKNRNTNGTRLMVGRMKSEVSKERLASKHAEVFGSVDDELAERRDFLVDQLDAEGNRMAGEYDAGVERQYKEFLNNKANDALDTMASARTIEDFEQAILLGEDEDFAMMPKAFHDEWERVLDETAERLERELAEQGNPGGQHGTLDGEPHQGEPEADGPEGEVSGNAGGAGTPRDPGNVGDDAAPVEPDAPNTLGEMLKDEGVISKIPLVNRQDPLIRSMLSKSIETRRTVQRLSETPLKYAKNALGVATRLPVEAIVRQSKAPLAFALKHLDDAFVKYRLGRAAKFGDKARLDLGDLVGATPNKKLNFEEFRQEVTKAMRRGDEHEIREVAAAAKKFREDVFDPPKQKAIDLGLFPEGVDVKTAASYITRVYDVEKIIAQRDEFFQRNLDWLRQKEARNMRLAQEEGRAFTPRSDAELSDVADQIIDRILGTPEGRLPYDLVTEKAEQGISSAPRGGGSKGKAKPLHERVYDIPDSMIEDFLENDIEVVAKIYERTMAADLAMIEEFGSLDLTDEIQAIRRDYAQKIRKAGSEAERKKLDGMMRSDIRDIAAMRDRIRGMYGLPADPSSAFVRVGKGLRTLNFLSLMGNVVVSSVADLGRPMMVHGLKRYLADGLVPLVADFKGFRASAEEVKLAGTALDMMLDGRMANIAELADDYGRGTKFEQTLGVLGQNFGKVSGISQWNSTMKQFAGMMTQSRILQAALDVKAGQVARKELQNLASSYIDPAMAKRIAEQFEQFGDAEGLVKLPNTSKWTDREAAKVFRAALARDVDRIIVTPMQDKPLWLSTEWGKLLGQFKSFFISASQRVMLAGIQDRDLGVLNGLVFSVGLGVVSALLSDKLKDGAPGSRPISKEPEALILEGVDRAGVTGWLFEVNNMAEKLTRGKYGFSAMLGKEPMSRYASRNVLDSIVGPSAGRIEDVARVTSAAANNDWTQSDTRAIRRLVPYQNLFYLRWLFDQGERGLNENMGFPASR